MTLDSIGAVLGFLGLIAPGVVFEMLREKRRPQVVESAFREAGRVALASLFFSAIGVAIERLVGWYAIFDADRPAGTTVWVTAALTDGTTFSGYMRHYSTEDDLDNREISISGQFMRKRGRFGSPEKIGENWDVVTFRYDRILYLQAVYVTAGGYFVRKGGNPV